MNIHAIPANISVSCLWELLARRASTSLSYGPKGHQEGFDLLLQPPHTWDFKISPII